MAQPLALYSKVDSLMRTWHAFEGMSNSRLIQQDRHRDSGRLYHDDEVCTRTDMAVKHCACEPESIQPAAVRMDSYCGAPFTWSYEYGWGLVLWV